jgi:hypothetical protein
MKNYEFFNYKVDVPEGLLKAIGKNEVIADNNDYNKTACVLEVLTKDDGEIVVNVASMHNTQTLAVRKVDRLYKEFKSKSRYYAGFSGVDYLALPATKIERKQTYIDTNGNIGDASELTMLDTSDWTDMMWAVVRWHGSSRHERVMHLINKDHEFVLGKHFDYTTKTWVELEKCTKCYLPITELNVTL